MIVQRLLIRRAWRFPLWLLPLVGMMLAILACSIGSLSPRRAIPPPVTHLPASQLRVNIQFSGQYDEPATVQVRVRFFEARTAQEVSLADKAHLTCNGSDVKPDFVLTHPAPSCPRQPPGGAYRIVYTDEEGAATTVVVPVPTGPFAILSPRGGSTVQIPTSGQLTVRYAIPGVPPTSSITIVSAIAWCHASSEQPCNSVMYSAPTAIATAVPGAPTATVFEYPGPPTPTPNSSIPTATEYEYRGPPTPTPPAGSTPTPSLPDTIVTQHGTSGTVVLIGGFTDYPLGTGKIEIGMVAHIAPDRGNFAAASATMDGHAVANITWTR
jgi:hypothetical protein